MSSYQFAHMQPPQRETQKNYVFVDEHNRHKRLKVMRACEGCRRRKIKCDAATTNTWPCSACIRLKLHCVKPNGFDGATDAINYDPPMTSAGGQFQLQTLPTDSATSSYTTQGFHDPSPTGYHTLGYDTTQAQPTLNYTAVPPPVSLVEQQYPQRAVFPTPPLQSGGLDEPSPEAYSPDSAHQHDLADLLGTLKVDETGAAPYLRNKASFRREESPAVEEDDDFVSTLPPLSIGAGLKIRIPPELMPSEESCLNYFDLYFTHVHPYVPVLDRSLFYHQWHTSRASISPLILEAIFAMGGRLAEDPAQGQQWLALASRHADSFMDIPRLSTLQALLMILKAREAAPKRGYYYRSWMTVVQCVQMAKDLGLDEHFEDHQVGRPCESTPSECQLRTRIWQTIFVCEVMVGTPQGRHDLAVDLDTVNFHVQPPIPGGDESEYQVSRNFTFFARVVRSIGNMSNVYARLKKKRRKEWGLDPEFQKLNSSFASFLPDLPPNLAVQFPPDGSPPWLSSSFPGNLLSYYYLSLILCHRPQLSFLDPNSPDGQWKTHMMICYDSAKALCKLQEAIVNQFGLTGLQCMQRGFSFTVYAGLSCIVLHLVAVVSPDPDLNSDAREYFARHMRIMEKVMDVWQMPELQRQIDAVREAFSADTRKPFVLKPSFPYGSPHPSHSSGSSPITHQSYKSPVGRVPMGQRLDTQRAQQVSYTSHPITPPVSAGPDSKNDSPSIQPLVMIPQSQAPGLQQGMPLSGQPGGWDPSRIFEQWNSTFGTPVQSVSTPGSQGSPLNIASSSGAPEVSPVQDIAAVNAALPAQAQLVTPQQYAAAMPSFVTPAMWQESVASVYEGGLKRAWDTDNSQMMKRR
ncbi:hypothetical protein B0I35DRAFT_452010 [Stachybotrys elegans]|uniref:Zn(2)-C6 fungal-type domain-containing protein n=1 Tax=Stachybotrys elegans TaxID=80388 RepID=A0A8K0ST70_9HYPO|nr:hypothetical protein B0I35DRAFT_452010 [Stachybotrys elegans]